MRSSIARSSSVGRTRTTSTTSSNKPHHTLAPPSHASTPRVPPSLPSNLQRRPSPSPSTVTPPHTQPVTSASLASDIEATQQAEYRRQLSEDPKYQARMASFHAAQREGKKICTCGAAQTNERERAALLKNFAEFKAQQAEHKARVQEFERRRASAADGVETAEKRAAELLSSVATLEEREQKVEVKERRVQQELAKAQGIEKHMESIKADVEARASALKTREEEVGLLRSKVDEKEADVRRREDKILSAKTELELAQSEVHSLRVALERKQQEVETLSRQQQLEAQRLSVEASRVLEESARLETERAAAQSEKTTAELARIKWESQSQLVEAEKEKYRNEIFICQKAKAEVEEERVKVRTERQRVEAAREDLEAAVRKHDDTLEHNRKLLEGEKALCLSRQQWCEEEEARLGVDRQRVLERELESSKLAGELESRKRHMEMAERKLKEEISRREREVDRRQKEIEWEDGRLSKMAEAHNAEVRRQAARLEEKEAELKTREDLLKSEDARLSVHAEMVKKCKEMAEELELEREGLRVEREAMRKREAMMTRKAEAELQKANTKWEEAVNKQRLAEGRTKEAQRLEKALQSRGAAALMTANSLSVGPASTQAAQAIQSGVSMGAGKERDPPASASLHTVRHVSPSPSVASCQSQAGASGGGRAVGSGTGGGAGAGVRLIGAAAAGRNAVSVPRGAANPYGRLRSGSAGAGGRAVRRPSFRGGDVGAILHLDPSRSHSRTPETPLTGGEGSSVQPPHSHTETEEESSSVLLKPGGDRGGEEDERSPAALSPPAFSYGAGGGASPGFIGEDDDRSSAPYTGGGVDNMRVRGDIEEETESERTPIMTTGVNSSVNKVAPSKEEMESVEVQKKTEEREEDFGPTPTLVPSQPLDRDTQKTTEEQRDTQKSSLTETKRAVTRSPHAVSPSTEEVLKNSIISPTARVSQILLSARKSSEKKKKSKEKAMKEDAISPSIPPPQTNDKKPEENTEEPMKEAEVPSPPPPTSNKTLHRRPSYILTDPPSPGNGSLVNFSVSPSPRLGRLNAVVSSGISPAAQSVAPHSGGAGDGEKEESALPLTQREAAREERTPQRSRRTGRRGSGEEGKTKREREGEAQRTPDENVPPPSTGNSSFSLLSPLPSSQKSTKKTPVGVFAYKQQKETGEDEYEREASAGTNAFFAFPSPSVGGTAIGEEDDLCYSASPKPSALARLQRLGAADVLEATEGSVNNRTAKKRTPGGSKADRLRESDFESLRRGAKIRGILQGSPEVSSSRQQQQQQGEDDGGHMHGSGSGTVTPLSTRSQTLSQKMGAVATPTLAENEMVGDLPRTDRSAFSVSVNSVLTERSPVFLINSAGRESDSSRLTVLSTGKGKRDRDSVLCCAGEDGEEAGGAPTPQLRHGGNSCTPPCKSTGGHSSLVFVSRAPSLSQPLSLSHSLEEMQSDAEAAVMGEVNEEGTGSVEGDDLSLDDGGLSLSPLI
uniref:Uncharacterized protein n=1 Tax=Chromera velia CCMP2878 TaxID=1169474 RepID=A0A0G4IAV9_9ALVE|eukprot:Cvel_12567.t1-p1 / transcript=Cvel_12567.t1 / gene=Cvel_12567 / organism=Chromera_velia_CCMP2878 / gene_product=Plectin, putative / transcript_product=Plectin, putative / location=Cvel_scaffold827:4088-14988(-) / protein_length=1471 / sequence_SO=supercontig / SO=protein_coding / is_pseudo=false